MGHCFGKTKNLVLSDFRLRILKKHTMELPQISTNDDKQAVYQIRALEKLIGQIYLTKQNGDEILHIEDVSKPLTL